MVVLCAAVEEELTLLPLVLALRLVLVLEL
jgi:hypothetical protein